ncbi:MAG: FIG01124596: hypothetical protein [uncultured Chloroflexia bacterium]|uniref:Phage protein D n=1 Tax=uncultured Chloroflexia bacterium TaxID=1672391 RepID=A0A6J4I684_9CHLR|nr:MAG: FIG01124596: hypothetical protein [uncultured Chloroflexia bacterium]
MLKGFYLTLLVGPSVPLPAPQPVVDALSSAQVTTSAGQASGFQLSFAVSKRSVLNRVLLPAGYLDPKVRVILMVTMNGLPTVLMDGVITRQELAPSNEPGQSKLTITGEDLTVMMDLEHNRACYPAMPANARVALICSKYALYGIVPAPVPPLLVDIPNPVKSIPVQSSTDLEYLKKLAWDVGYVFYIDPGPAPGVNVAYWGPEIRIGIPQPALSVNMDADTNVESLSFSFDGQAKTQFTVTVTEPITKLPIPVPIPDVGILRPPLAARPAPALRKAPLPTAKQNPVKAALLGLAQTAQASDAISGSGQLDVLRYGHILKARRLVGVRGAGITYDGHYYVKSVTHNIKRGEYRQSFTLARDGLLPLIPKVMP